MAKKVYLIENLDCANCAAKIEAKFNAHPQVQEAVITFATRQLRLTAQDPDELIPELTRLAQTVEPDAQILPRDSAHAPHAHTHTHHDHEECSCSHHDHHHGHDESCSCGHDHHHDHGKSCSCGHDHHHDHDETHHSTAAPADADKWELLLGGGLFLLGLALDFGGLSLISRLIFVLSYLVLGRDVLLTAGKNLLHGHVLDENFLMSLATVGAFAIGEFSEAVGVMLFYRIGEYFEEKAVSKSRSQIMDAVDLRPEVVNLMTEGQLRVIPAEDAQVGDTLLVRPGDRIPLDGTVLTGESRIDTAPITGEPVPVGVHPGSRVTSGCVNTTGQLTIRVENPLADSMVTRILDSVENAAASKPQFERFITRFARIYTPVVVTAAVLVALIPSLISGQWNYWIYTALSFLVMSCPCALVLSVPLAFFSGIGAGSRQGILFKGGVSIEALGAVKAVVMDKTGTVTRGDFRVRQIHGPDDLLGLLAAAEQHSTHPIAISIVEAAKEQGISLAAVDGLEEIPGLGIRAKIGEKTVLCGNEKLLAQADIVPPEVPIGSGTCVHAVVDGAYAGYLIIDDTLKDGAADAIRRLQKRGIFTAMLTGDDDRTAQAIAAQTNIEEVHAKLLPEEKLHRLQDIRTRRGAVMFVGDGINDAPVLAGADVGAAMGSGADAAIEAADVVFMTSSVDAIPASLEIAVETRRIAWQNVIFALAVKLIVMILGLTGHASMWMAVFADSGVAMLCVLNSIRLLYRK